MAYDEGLVERIRVLLSSYPAVAEKKMFGGLSFIIQGNYACGVIDTLVVRVGKDRHAEVMAQAHSRIMDFTGRAMKGWVYEDPPAIEDDEDLAQWVQMGVDYALSLPPKQH